MQSGLVICLIPWLVLVCRKKNSHNTKRIVHAALVLTFPMLLIDLVFYIAISLTSMCSALILSNSSIVFVFVFSLFLLREDFLWGKLIGVIVALESVVLIVLTDDHQNEKSSTLGNLTSFIDAFFVAAYAILMQRLLTEDLAEKMSFFTLLGFIGFFTVITSWIIVLIAHLAEIETFEFPTPKAWINIGINMVFGTILYEYFVA